jgi:transcriptional regulator with XRE-family HTH domain
MAETFAARLKRLREAAGISQVELAGRAGLHTYSIAKFEQGQREPSLESAQALAKALGVSLATFDDVAFDEAQADKAPPRTPGRPRKPTAEQAGPAAGQGGADAAGGKPAGKKGNRGNRTKGAS